MIGFMSLLVLVYCIVMLFYTFKFKAFQGFELAESPTKSSFSIIIPFRNEAEYLPQLLKSLSELNYPKSLFEIILVDDHSEDDSRATCEDWVSKLDLKNTEIVENQNLSESPKKSAILSAIKVVNKNFILTTDADCLVPENWLKFYDQHIQKNDSDLIAGPVKIIEEGNFWTKFQVLDLMSLQVLGLGSFKTPSALICNAANLCYKVDALKEIKAFQHHKDVISGDDIFNLEAFQNAGKKVSALVHEHAVVWTKPEKDFHALTQQRIRWASKAKFYKNTWLIAIGFIVFLTNLSLVLSLILAFRFDSFQYFWWLWLFKISVDFYLLYTGNHFFKTNLCLRDYLVMLLVYPFTSVYFAALSFSGKFSWKGRDYKV